MFLKQLNDGNQSFKLMKINISSTTWEISQSSEVPQNRYDLF